MEGLDLLKRDWNKREKGFPEFSEHDIYRMIHKRSSSIVKWIFIISIIEILFWTIIQFLMVDDDYRKMVENYHLAEFLKVSTIVHYVVLVAFVILFYFNFRNISTGSSVRILMNNILKTRKIVNYYVWYNIIVMFISMIFVWKNMITYDATLNDVFEKSVNSGSETGFWVGVLITMIVMIALAGGILWLFYRLVYGILLKRLQKNYKELERIEF
jgi:hypothetical protein